VTISAKSHLKLLPSFPVEAGAATTASARSTGGGGEKALAASCDADTPLLFFAGLSSLIASPGTSLLCLQDSTLAEAFAGLLLHQTHYHHERLRSPSAFTNNNPMTFKGSPSGASSAAAAEAVWASHQDEASGRTYYVNSLTGTTSWDPPAVGDSDL